jgi:hypothetical protein
MELGVATLGATLAGILGQPLPVWNEPCVVVREARPHQLEEVWDPDAGGMVIRAKTVVAATILVPTSFCVALARTGATLGFAGFVLSVRRRRVSWVSTIGFVSTLPGPCAGRRTCSLFICSIDGDLGPG